MAGNFVTNVAELYNRFYDEKHDPYPGQEDTARLYAALVEPALISAGRIPLPPGTNRETATNNAFEEALRCLQDVIVDATKPGESVTPNRGNSDGDLSVMLWALPKAIADLHDSGLGHLTGLYQQAGQRLSELFIVQKVTAGTNFEWAEFYRTGVIDRSKQRPLVPTPLIECFSMSQTATNMVKTAESHNSAEHEILSAASKMQRAGNSETTRQTGVVAQSLENTLRFRQLGLDPLTRSWLIKRGYELIGEHGKASEISAALRGAATDGTPHTSLEHQQTAVDRAADVLTRIGDVNGAKALRTELQNLHTPQRAGREETTMGRGR